MRMRILREFLWAGVLNDSGVVNDGDFFGDFGGCFFGNVRYSTNNITRRYAIPCRPVIDRKMNDLE